MAQVIPFTPSVPWQEVTTTIDYTDGSSDTYTFEIRWNTRDNAWYLNVSDVNQQPIVTGVKVVLGIYLGRRSLHPLFQQGVLVAVDTSNSAKEATLDDLGTRVQIRRYNDLEILASRGVLATS